MLCQTCANKNPIDAEFCARCGSKLLVVSGEYTLEDQEAFDTRQEEQYTLDEHLLERVSILEEVMRRTTESLRQVLGTLYVLEQKILVNDAGLTTLKDLLQNKRLIEHQEWSELWEARMDRQLLALEKRERFGAVKERIQELYDGERRGLFDEFLEQAEYSLLGLDIDSAMEVLGEAHEMDPKNFELSFFLGETCFNEGRADDALAYFTRVLGVKPHHFESLVYSGVICHEQGRETRAEDLLKHAVGHYPETFLPAFSLGAVYAGGGSFPQAVVLLEQAVAAQGVMPQARYLLGSCYYEMGKLRLAMDHLQEAVRQDPAFVEAHHLLGLAYLDRGWHKKALDAFRLAQRLRPSRLEYQELMQFLGPEPGRVPELKDESVHWLSRAEAALLAGHEREALSAYRRAVAQDPENPALLVSYAMACLELERSEDIEPTIERVLEMDPGEALEAVAFATWIESLRAEGRFREGVRLGEHLLERTETPLGRTVACFELACNLAEMEEDLDAALDYARRALDGSPEGLQRFPLAILGWVHFKRRELGDAVDCLTRSNALGSSARSLTHLGIALLAAGDLARARDAMARARGLEERRGGLQATVFQALAAGARLLQDTPRSPEP